VTPQAAGSREARLTGRKLQQLVHINLVTSPPGAWCVDRILFGIHDDHVDAGLRCAIIGAVGSLRALCLPTFSHFLNVTKPFLSLSLSLSLSSRFFFPWMAGHPRLTLRARSLSFQGDPAKWMIPARQLYQGGCGSVWILNPRKSGSVIGADRQRFGPSCVAETRATRPNGEWGYRTRRQCWATSAQLWCHPEDSLYLLTFSHIFDCK